MPDGRLIICTDQGEIMLLEGSGDYKMLLAESPGEGFFIETIIVYSKGFIIGGENGQIMIYEKSEEPKNPYHRIATLPTTTDSKSDKDYPMLMAGVMSSKVRWMSLNASEDSLVFTTENNQLMRVPINIERPTDDAKYEYLVYPFHSRGINGMDVCIKKQLVGTCGADKTVRIWNYYTKNLEICEIF
jgi:WD40 repeat protein